MQGGFHRINLRAFAHLTGILLIIVGVAMLVPFFAAAYYNEPLTPFAVGVLFNISVGLFLFLSVRKASIGLELADSFVFVGCSWFIVPLSAAIPYVLSGAFTSALDAIFESVSGFTATGWSSLRHIEDQPRCILLWRSLSQWMGGMGVTLMLVLLLKKLGKGANYLFNSEFRGPDKTKIHPHISSTVRHVYLIYLSFTFVQFLLLNIGDMPSFDALCYTLSTVSSGGFSLNDKGAATLSPYSQYVLILFMFLSSINLLLVYWIVRGKFSYMRKDEQLKWFFWITIGLSLLLGIYFLVSENMDWERSLRFGLFQMNSLLSSTGFILDHNVYYTPFLSFTFFFLMFLGGSSGTTSSGLKLVRVLLLYRFVRSAFRRIFHPRAIVPVKYNGAVVRDETINNVFGFVFLYILILFAGMLLFAFCDNSFYESFLLSASSLGNIGPVSETFYPYISMPQINTASKGVMMILMIIGRLEIYSFLAIFAIRIKR